MSAKLKLIETDLEALIPLTQAAKMLGLDPSTVRQRKANTAELTIIPQGRNLYLVLGEVIDHRRNLINNARRKNDVKRMVRR